MVARLGVVLYWAGCFMALLAAVWVAANVIYYPADWPGMIPSALVGVVAWGLGRAALYVLAAR